MPRAQAAQARRVKPRGEAKAQQAEPGRARRRKTTRKQAAAGYSRAGTGALTADLKLGELAGQLKALAPKPDKPLKGTTVPAVNLKRGSQGPGVKLLQSALVKLRYMTQAQMDTGPGIFGAKTEAALKKFQKAQGVDPLGVYGPKTRAAFASLGATVRGGGTTPSPAPQGLRQKIVEEGQWGAHHASPIHYAQRRPIDGIHKRHKLPLFTDCSGFVTLCYKWAGAPDPNGCHYNGSGYTGTLEAHMRHIPQSRIQPGDLCLWRGKHVSLVIKAGADPLLVSHGNERGPYAIRLSSQRRYFRGSRLVWLTSPARKRAELERLPAPILSEGDERSDPPAEEGLPEEELVPLPPDL